MFLKYSILDKMNKQRPFFSVLADISFGQLVHHNLCTRTFRILMYVCRLTFDISLCGVVGYIFGEMVCVNSCMTNSVRPGIKISQHFRSTIWGNALSQLLHELPCADINWNLTAYSVLDTRFRKMLYHNCCMNCRVLT